MPKSLSDIFLEQVKLLGLRFPGAAITKKTGYGSAIVSEYLNGKKAVSERFLKAFCEGFDLDYNNIIKAANPVTTTILPDTDDLKISVSEDKEVIMLGKQAYMRLPESDYRDSFSGWHGLPMYNVPISASFVEAYRDETYVRPQYFLHDPRFRDCDFGAIITGDSMHSEIRHGDFVACKEITDKRFLVFGDIYYIVSTNGMETCKYVNQDPDDKDNLLLVPKNEKLSSSPIPKDMILKIFKVRGIIRGY